MYVLTCPVCFMHLHLQMIMHQSTIYGYISISRKFIDQTVVTECMRLCRRSTQLYCVFQEGHTVHGFPAYHTTIDNFDMLKRFFDSQFLAHESMSHIIGDVVLRMATSTRYMTKLLFYICQQFLFSEVAINWEQSSCDKLGLYQAALHKSLLNIKNISFAKPDPRRTSMHCLMFFVVLIK